MAVNEFIQRYFVSEKQTALLNVFLGLAMIAAGALLRRWSAAGAFQRGVAYPCIAIGLLLSASATAVFVNIDQRSDSTVRGYKEVSEAEARTLETARLENVVNHSYTGAFWICGVLIAFGVALGSISGLHLSEVGSPWV